MDRRFIVFAIFLFENAAGYITSYYMDNYCTFGTGSGTIDISGADAIRLRLTSSWQYDENMDCTVKIQTSYSNQLMLYFRSIDIEGTEGSCDYDYLRIYDGSSSSSSYVSGFYGKQCGSHIRSSVETSTGNTVTLRFKSDGSMQETGFDMVITSYDDGFCDSSEYECSNGRCIDNSITCNGYNPCGDYSDCSLSSGAITGIVSGCLSFAFVIFIVTVIFCRRRRLLLQARPAVQHNQVATVSTTVGNTYSQPFPQQQYGAPPQYPGIQGAGQYPVGAQYPATQPYPQQPIFK